MIVQQPSAVSPQSSAGADTSEIVARHRELMFPWVKPYYEEPLVLRDGQGVRVRDASGVEYLDLFAGILTTSVGHCHPRVVDAIAQQAARLGHTSTLYVTEQQLRVAEQLRDIAPAGLTRFAFTNSGSEAVETAVMAACVFTGRSEVVALRYGYSGRSALTTNLTGHSTWRPVASGVAGIKHARAPYVYRSPLGASASDERQVDFFIDDLIETIETSTNGKPAALLIESIMGVGGFLVPPPGYLRRAAEVIRSFGGLYIADEVQTGFGRTGDHWFGVGHDGIAPDLMVVAKGIANGAPVGATAARADVADAWRTLSISTFGGNPISMAAASATLDVLVEEDAPARAAARGRQLRAGLDAIAARHEWIGDVRGRGLMQALEIVTDAESRAPNAARARALLEAARAERLLIGLGGLKGNIIRMGPSLLVSEAEVDEALEKLARACARAEAVA